MKLRGTTKMAYQAAMAIGIAEIISMCFYVERGYWITASAMALTAQTWGESVKRSFERVGMTILGGVTGTILYFIIPRNDSMLLLFLALFFIFLMIYLAKIHSLISVFFLTCFIVFLFALIGDWNLHLLQARIIDTILGAVVALGVNCFFLSSKTDIADLFSEYLQKISAMLASTFEADCQPQTAVPVHLLSAEFQKIKNNALSIRYELLFHRLSPRDFNTVLNKLSFCTQFTINIIEAHDWISTHLTKDEIATIALAAKTTTHNINAVNQRLQGNKHAPMLPATNLTDFLTQEITVDPYRFATLESDALGFFNLIYLFSRLNTCLNDIYTVLSKTY